jgi:hypothetical protein
MNMAGMWALGLFVAISTGSTYAQIPSPGDAGTTNDSFSGAVTGQAAAVPEPNAKRLHRLFTIGGIPAYVYAPVEPPYSSEMNRSLAADPIWEPGF